MKAVFPGSFDPVTLGHVNLIQRGAKMYDEIIVAVLNNPGKNSLFTFHERVAMLEAALAGTPNIKVEEYAGLLVDFAKSKGAGCILRGLRSQADCAYELPRAQGNMLLGGGLETVMLAAEPQYSCINASFVREAALVNGFDIKVLEQWVPPAVVDMLKSKQSGD